MPEVREIAVGIDLGTTNSCCAVVRGGRPEVIPNAEGDRVTPSAVAFKESGEIVVGKLAKRQAVLNPSRTVLSIKRRMGTDHRVEIRVQGENRTYTPEQISAFILQKIKRDAEAYLNTTISKAVITVPAYFDIPQREATVDAGEIAGLEVLRIINEPTAAALAYGLDREEDQRILVYDLGGGTFDVSILSIGGGLFEVIAVDGNTQLGGDDFDFRIMEWLLEEFKRETGLDLREDPVALQRLRDAAEQAKIELSSLSETFISLPYITRDAHLEKRITRAMFESLVKDLLESTVEIVDRALEAARLRPEDIQHVILVGGSTRIPKVQELVAQKFGRAKINREVNPDEVVAVGAAIQAGILTGEIDKGTLLLDVTPLTLAVETYGGVATPIIERNTKVPVERTKTFTTATDFQTEVDIHIVQGERPMAADNRSLGRLRLTGILQAPRGVPQIDVTFAIDVNGILHVTAKDRATNAEVSVVITDTHRLPPEEIKRMQEEAKRYEEEDRKKAEEARIRNEAESLIYSVEQGLTKVSIAPEKRAQVERARDILKDKLAQKAELAQVRSAMEELKRLWGEIAEEVYRRAQKGPGR